VRVAWRFLRPATAATIALVVLLALPRLSTSRAVGIWVVLVAALVLVMLIRHFRERERPARAARFEEALRGRRPPGSEAVELLRIERDLLLGIADADHAHRRLLPLLRAAAAAHLSARHGLELERRPEEARALLGDDVWDLLRPDRPAPENRRGPGVPRERVAAVIERVESL
jgi:hypothetical protein